MSCKTFVNQKLTIRFSNKLNLTVIILVFAFKTFEDQLHLQLEVMHGKANGQILINGHIL